METQQFEFHFISNNVKGLQDKYKRPKIFNYLKDNIKACGIIYMQETHSCDSNEKRWREEMGEDMYFSH